MEKKYLIPNTRQHKANLHCHTTLSDGRIAPEEMAAAYKKHGYGVIAFTDHEYLTYHRELEDESFIVLTGYEIGLYTPAPEGSWEDTWRDRKCCHLNLYAKNPLEDRHVMFDPDAVPAQVRDKAQNFRHIGDICKRNYEDVQKVIDTANENGYIVCLNHPYWSIQTQEDIVRYKGLFACEVFNSGGSALASYNPFIDTALIHDYGAMIDKGLDIAPIAADDNHNYNCDIENSDSFKGYSMICTDDFTYDGIMSAMQRGDLYASTGIDISELYTENGKLYVKCSPSRLITVYFGGIRWAHKKGECDITCAEFDIPKGAKYIRVVCTSEDFTKTAVTKAYFL